MKRVIKASAELYSAFKDYYPVTQITKNSFPGTVSYNVTDSQEKANKIDRSSIRQYKLYPNSLLIMLLNASADNLLEDLAYEYELDSVSPQEVADLIRSENASGIYAVADGTLIMLPEEYELR